MPWGRYIGVIHQRLISVRRHSLPIRNQCRQSVVLTNWARSYFMWCRASGRNVLSIESLKENRIADSDGSQRTNAYLSRCYHRTSSVKLASGDVIATRAGEEVNELENKPELHSPEEIVGNAIREMLDLGHINEKQSESPVLRSFVEALVKLKVQKYLIKKLFKYNNTLYKGVSLRELENTVFMLKHAGFNIEDIIQALSCNELIFRTDVGEIKKSISALMSLSFREKQISKLCASNPEILTTPAKKLFNQFNHLTQTFSKSELCKLMLQNSTLLTDSLDVTQEKIDYIKDNMGVDMKYVLDSNVFMFPLSHLKARHLCLERTGLYKRPDRLGRTVVENTTFKKIVDSDRRYFCRKIAGISSEEYKVFCKMVEEFDNDDSDEYDSGDETDDE